MTAAKQNGLLGLQEFTVLVEQLSSDTTALEFTRRSLEAFAVQYLTRAGARFVPFSKSAIASAAVLYMRVDTITSNKGILYNVTVAVEGHVYLPNPNGGTRRAMATLWEVSGFGLAEDAPLAQRAIANRLVHLLERFITDYTEANPLW